MITHSLSRRELSRFEEGFIGPRKRTYQIAIAPRRFDAMVDVEAMMWLQLGAELEIFRQSDVRELFEKHRDRLLGSMKYLERVKVSKLFRGEAEILSKHIGTEGIPFMGHPLQVNPQLFDSSLVLMLFHEVGRCFRTGDLTMCLAYSSSGKFQRYVREKWSPEAILRGKHLSGLNLLISQCLGFLGHAGSLEELWGYMASVCESNYALTQLQTRVRAAHNWRLDLHDPKVLERFESFARLLVQRADEDDALVRMGFNSADLAAEIEVLCDSWCGNGGSFLADDAPGGSSKQQRNAGAGRADKAANKVADKKKPPMAA
ncbi:MAG TPA: hypothetical protein VGM18_18150 [Candidatus Sulfotelmatobacter sp.]|jgi:hypothetical protein